MTSSHNDNIILYDHDGSPCSRRVKITLAEKGIPYSIQKVDLGKMQQKTKEYLAINPNGLVPTLSHNGRIIFESSVINDYLEDQFPSIRLSPTTYQGKVAAQRWQNQELAMAKLYRPLMYSRIMGPLYRIACTKQEFLKIASQATDNPAHLTWEEKVYDLKILSPEHQMVHQRLVINFANSVERQLEGKQYLVDEHFSFADISVYPRLVMFSNAGIKLSEYEYPNINRWMNELAQRNSFKSTISSNNQSVARLSKLGIINSINRVVYQQVKPSIKDKLTVKALKPLFRKVLDIDASLQNNPPPAIHLTPSNNNACISSMPAISKKQIDRGLLTKKNTLTLYGFKYSPICQRVKYLLDASRLAYQWQEIDIAQNEHKSSEFLSLNPLGELPLLQIDDICVPDSLYIAEAINEYSKDLNLFSEDAWERAQIRMWHALDMGMHKEFGVLFYHNLGTKPATDAEIYQAKAILTEKLAYLDTHLANKNYIECDRLTYADIVMFTRLQYLETTSCSDCYQDHENTQRWLENIAPEINAITKPKSAKKQKATRPESA